MDEGTETPKSAVERHRGTLGIVLGVAALGYVAYAAWKGLDETRDQLVRFQWAWYLPVLALTLVNYGLRFAKWAWLLHRLGVQMPTWPNLLAFVAGLGMVVSPGKAGELVKPWLVREITGEDMMRTIPALVTERLTDGIAVVLLAAIGVTTFRPDSSALIAATLAICAAGIVVVSSETLMLGLLRVVGRVGPLAGVAGRAEAAWRALRTCLGPVPLVVTILMSVVAWWAECVGYWLVFRGMGVEASLDAATFLYAFATVFGAPSPGGVGMADAFLAEAAVGLVPGLSGPQAFAAALLIRVATLWFGVLLGALVLMRIDAVVRIGRAARP